MSEAINNGGPAFPLPFVYDPDRGECGQYVDANDAGVPCGMTIRQYAAIHLRVPNSGEAWLDEMIRESQREAFAGQALVGIITKHEARHGDDHEVLTSVREICEGAYLYADAMRTAREAR